MTENSSVGILVELRGDRGRDYEAAYRASGNIRVISSEGQRFPYKGVDLKFVVGTPTEENLDRYAEEVTDGPGLENFIKKLQNYVTGKGTINGRGFRGGYTLKWSKIR